MIAMNIFYAPKDNKPFNYERYVTHMRLASTASGGAVKAAFIQKEIPGKGYTATGDETWPTHVCIGTLIFDSYEDFEQKFKPYVVPLRDDVRFVSDLRAYTNFYDIIQVPMGPLNDEEQKLLDGYMANASLA